MRILVFFFLPSDTDEQIEQKEQFIAFLLEEGYVMLQQTVYAKLVVNANALDEALGSLRAHRPAEGKLWAFKVTDKQYPAFILNAGRWSDPTSLEGYEEAIEL